MLLTLYARANQYFFSFTSTYQLWNCFSIFTFPPSYELKHLRKVSKHLSNLKWYSLIFCTPLQKQHFVGLFYHIFLLLNSLLYFKLQENSSLNIFGKSLTCPQTFIVDETISICGVFLKSKGAELGILQQRGTIGHTHLCASSKALSSSSSRER